MMVGCGYQCPALTTYELPPGFVVLSDSEELEIRSPYPAFAGVLFQCPDSEEVCYMVADFSSCQSRVSGGNYTGSTFPDQLEVETFDGGEGVRFRTNIAVPIVADLAQTVVGMHCAASRQVVEQGE